MSAELPFGTSVGDWRITIPVDGVIEITHNGGNVLRLPSGRSSIIRSGEPEVVLTTDADSSVKLIVSAGAVTLVKDGSPLASIGDFDENLLYVRLSENFPASILAATANPGAVQEDPSAGGRRQRQRKSSRKHTRRSRKFY